VIHTVLADDTEAKFALNAADDAPGFTFTVAGIVRAGSLLYRDTGVWLCAVPLRLTVHTSVPAELKELLWQEILLTCSVAEVVVPPPEVVVPPPEVVVPPPEVVVPPPEVVVPPPEVVVPPPEVVVPPPEVVVPPPEVVVDDEGLNWIP
jgi:hypothetical protein